MFIKTPRKKMLCVFACLMVVILAVACGGSPAAETVSASPESEESLPPGESSQQIEQPDSDPSNLIMAEELVYPGSQFLVEVPGLGGPMTPWQFYAAPNVSTDEAANFYLERLSFYEIESDEIINGHRYLMLSYSDALSRLEEIDGFDELVEVAGELDGTLIGVEVVRSGAVTGLNRLGLLMDSYEDGLIMDSNEEIVNIPTDTTIIILEFFNNPY